MRHFSGQPDPTKHGAGSLTRVEHASHLAFGPGGFLLGGRVFC